MNKYVCENEKCGWNGEKDEVKWVYGFRFLHLEEPMDEHDLQLISACPTCESLTMAFEIKI